MLKRKSSNSRGRTTTLTILLLAMLAAAAALVVAVMALPAIAAVDGGGDMRLGWGGDVRLGGDLPELGKAVITPDDFEFMGAFTLPNSYLAGGWLQYFGGLTHRYVEGKLKLYTLPGPYASRPPGGYLLEIEVPDNISLTLPYPRQTEYVNFGDIYQDKITLITAGYSVENPAVGLVNTSIPNGIYWDEQDQRLYWTKVTSYDNAYRPDTGLGYALLDDETHTGKGVGSWIIPSDVAPTIGRRWAFSMTGIPQWFADAYLGGRRLGLGFGGCASIITNGVSRGPAFFAIKPPNPQAEPHMSQLTTPSIAMISHLHGYDTPARRNTAMPNLVGSGDPYAWDVYDGVCPSGVWIDGEYKHGLVAFATMPCGNANTKVAKTISLAVIEVEDPGDIRPGDQIFINTDWLDDGRMGYQCEAAMVAGMSGNIITLANPLKGNPIINGYTVDVTYKNGTVMTIAYTNQVRCGTVYYGGDVRSSRFFNTWYIYDPADLALSASGQLARDQIQPVYNGRADFPNISYPRSGDRDSIIVKGTTFDARTKRLYLLTSGYESVNTVYIYQLKDVPPQPELDSELISTAVNGEPYAAGSAPVALVTDEIFKLSAVIKNTGTKTWGQEWGQGERGATLLSRGPDYNEVFGTFLIIPGQGSRVAPGETFTYSSLLRAPPKPGEYTMTWQLADWIIPNVANNYMTKPFYGDTISVKVTVAPRPEQPPPQKPRLPGVLDVLDFEYQGSFSLPGSAFEPPISSRMIYNDGGITLRTADGEKRMLLDYRHTLYEVAIPELGKIIGSDTSAVPEAKLRTIFGKMPLGAGATTNGAMWYDEEGSLLYWTNYNEYLVTALTFPILRSASLSGDMLTEVQQWFYPPNAPIHYKSFWGGVTNIPDSFAQKYTGGRKLALGFGGYYSGVQTVSMGPSVAAVSPDIQSGEMDFLNIMYYPYTYPSLRYHCIRDGNYFQLMDWSPQPINPWQGWWTAADTGGSGVFIDLPDKKGFIAFVKQAKGRVGYDYGHITSAGRQNAWYFYDFDTLGKAATGDIPKEGLTPSSLTVVEYPNELTRSSQYATGSCFDPETRRLYIYTLGAVFKTGFVYAQPAVHVYTIKEDATVTGAVLYQDSPISATISLYNNQGTLITYTDTADDGAYALTAPATAEDEGYTLVVTKPGYLSYTIKNLTLTNGLDIETIDIRQLAGDVNGDGIVNAVDLTCLLSEFNRSPLKFFDADIDGNGIVNAADLTYLLAGFNKRDIEEIRN